MKIIKSTKLPHLTKGLIGNYHYGLNIEHAKHVLENIINKWICIGRDINATKQTARREGGPAVIFRHECKPNLYKLERTLKKFKDSIGV